MSKVIIKNARIVNRGKIFEGDLLVNNDRIERIAAVIDEHGDEHDAQGKILMPGIIDDQVHFREPGLTHKANIASESAAALAGGTTSFMEMPNTNPTTTVQARLQDKFDIAAQSAHTNYSFFFGATNDNLEEVLKTDASNVCGIKVFMGSSTGNMLVDNRDTLEKLFASTPMLIATHCEDEQTIRDNFAKFKTEYGDKLDATYHPKIRNHEGCYLSSSMAIELAKKHNTRLHILHISTAKELDLFRNDIPLREKRITSEVCVHHLSFNESQYPELGNKIKCNPAIKSKADQNALFEALLDNRLDIIATDHAPHTIEEKAQHYLKAPSGLPLVQHALNMMLRHHHAGKISLERMVEKMCHAPADCFRIIDRGYLDEGAFADMVLVDPDHKWTVSKSNLLYHCGWSPLEGETFRGKATDVWVNGSLSYADGKILQVGAGRRLLFDK